MCHDKNYSYFAPHIDWYKFVDDIGYIPTDVAPEDAIEAMMKYNSYTFNVINLKVLDVLSGRDEKDIIVCKKEEITDSLFVVNNYECKEITISRLLKMTSCFGEPLEKMGIVINEKILIERNDYLIIKEVMD